jgi:hypothetical protein
MGTLTASTLSTTTTTELPSPHSYPSTTPRSSRITSNDDDEIVWNVSEGDMTYGSAQSVITEEDFVVIAKSRFDSLTSVENEPLEQKTLASATRPLEMQMSTLSLSSKSATTKKAKRTKRSKKATASPVQGTTTTQRRNGKNSVDLAGDANLSPTQSSKHEDIVQVLLFSISRSNPQFIPVKVVSAMEHLGLGQRPIVDDLSEQLSVISGDRTPTVYEEASTYISMCVPSPDINKYYPR